MATKVVCSARLAAKAARSGIFSARLAAAAGNFVPVVVEGLLPRLVSGGDITVGRGVSFRSLTARTEMGAAPGGHLTLGDRVYVNQGCSIIASHSITIGSDVLIAPYVSFDDSAFHPLEPGAEIRTAAVVVGDGAWIGRNTIVLPGTEIGAGTVVGAGSLVSKDLPPGVLAMGRPAVAVRGLKLADGWVRR